MINNNWFIWYNEFSIQYQYNFQGFFPIFVNNNLECSYYVHQKYVMKNQSENIISFLFPNLPYKTLSLCKYWMLKKTSSTSAVIRADQFTHNRKKKEQGYKYTTIYSLLNILNITVYWSWYIKATRNNNIIIWQLSN